LPLNPRILSGDLILQLLLLEVPNTSSSNSFSLRRRRAVPLSSRRGVRGEVLRSERGQG